MLLSIITKNREQYKRLLNFVAALIIIFFFMMGFSHVWYNYYNSTMHDPFWHYGNLLMVGIYGIMYTTVSSLFNGFQLQSRETRAVF